MPQESWRDDGQVFDDVADTYDRVRSGYPAGLVDLALARGRLSAGSRVLEVGCGTGKLTELLGARGLEVDAVEPGANMIRVARRHVAAHPSVRFHLGRFEDVVLPREAFEAAFSATAFHWVDPAVGWAKTARHLRPGGLLALLQHVDVRNELSAAVDDAFVDALREHASDVAGDWRPSPDLDALVRGADERRGNVSEVWDWVGRHRHGLAVPEAAELFSDVEIHHELRHVTQTADELAEVFRTTSLSHRLDPAARDAVELASRAVIEATGGTVTFSLVTVLATARRS